MRDNKKTNYCSICLQVMSLDDIKRLKASLIALALKGEHPNLPATACCRAFPSHRISPVARGVNGMDSICSYSSLNSFKGVNIFPYQSPDI